MENTFSIALKNRTGLRIVHRPSKRLLQVVQTLLQIVHGVAQYMAARTQRNLRRVLHQVILDAGEGVSHARAFYEVRVLIVVSVVMIAQWAMQAMRAAAIGCHQGLVIFKRVLVIVTLSAQSVSVYLEGYISLNYLLSLPIAAVPLPLPPLALILLLLLCLCLPCLGQSSSDAFSFCECCELVLKESGDVSYNSRLLRKSTPESWPFECSENMEVSYALGALRKVVKLHSLGQHIYIQQHICMYINIFICKQVYTCVCIYTIYFRHMRAFNSDICLQLR